MAVELMLLSILAGVMKIRGLERESEREGGKGAERGEREGGGRGRGRVPNASCKDTHNTPVSEMATPTSLKIPRLCRKVSTVDGRSLCSELGPA